MARGEKYAEDNHISKLMEFKVENIKMISLEVAHLSETEDIVNEK